jgi:hypothetical protein
VTLKWHCGPHDDRYFKPIARAVDLTPEAKSQANYPLKNDLGALQKAEGLATKSPTPRMTISNRCRDTERIKRSSRIISIKSQYFIPDLLEEHSLVLTLRGSSGTWLSSRYAIQRIP